MKSTLNSLYDFFRRTIVPHRVELEQRRAIDESEMWNRYYRNSGLKKTDVRELWIEVSECLKVPSEKIRPSDELVQDLSPHFLVDTPEIENLFDIATERSEKMGGDVEGRMQKLVTLDDYILTFARHD